MGMFDDIKFVRPQVKCECGYSPKNFQTKSLDCYLDQYKVTNEGRLQILKYETVVSDDRNNFGFPICVRTNERWEDTALTTTINCYNSCDGCGRYWFDIELIFVYGYLDKINIETVPIDEKFGKN